MANRPHQKQRLLVLLRLLYKKTDAEHGLTTQQIIEGLACEGLEAERKAIYRDIRALNDAGFAVSNHGGTGWHLDTRPFDFEELTMLADATQSSPFLTDGMTDSLIEKLKALASESQRGVLERRIEVPSRVKMQNAHALENVDTVQRSMNPLIDKFGLDALVFKRESGKIFASVRAPLSPQFFGWLLQLGPYVKIAGPRHVREQFLQQLESARSQYEER